MVIYLNGIHICRIMTNALVHKAYDPGNRNIIYRSPKLYDFMLKLVHGKHLSGRYEHIAMQIMGGKKSLSNGMLRNPPIVLEPMCGTGLLRDYLPPEISYFGFDINANLAEHANRKFGSMVWVGDVRDVTSYKSHESDIVVLIDALHHVGEEDTPVVLEHATKAAKKKIIVCEPFGDQYFSMMESWLPKGIARWFYNWIERDGVGESTFDRIRTKAELSDRIQEGYGVLNEPTSCVQVGAEDLIAVYNL